MIESDPILTIVSVRKDAGILNQAIVYIVSKCKNPDNLKVYVDCLTQFF